MRGGVGGVAGAKQSAKVNHRLAYSTVVKNSISGVATKVKRCGPNSRRRRTTASSSIQSASQPSPYTANAPLLRQIATVLKKSDLAQLCAPQ